MKIIYALIFVFLLCFVVQAQSSKETLKEKNETELGFCDLIKNFEKYKDKEVTVKATYRYGFEQAELYCIGCIENKVWVEFDESFKKNSKSKYTKKIIDNAFRGRTVNVEVTGTLFSGGFGHFGVYPYKFVVKSLRMAEVVADKGLSPNALSEDEQKKLCQK
jgi:hypothetical protein